MKNELFDELVASVREGGAILRGEAPPARAFAVEGPDVLRIRTRFQLSQSEFAALLGISVAMLRNWEQGRRKPEGPARILLQVAAIQLVNLRVVDNRHAHRRPANACLGQRDRNRAPQARCINRHTLADNVE